MPRQKSDQAPVRINLTWLCSHERAEAVWIERLQVKFQTKFHHVHPGATMLQGTAYGIYKNRNDACHEMLQCHVVIVTSFMILLSLSVVTKFSSTISLYNQLIKYLLLLSFFSSNLFKFLWFLSWNPWSFPADHKLKPNTPFEPSHSSLAWGRLVMESSML